MHWHRGPTHGPLGVVALGLVSAAIAWVWTARQKPAREAARASFPVLAVWAMIGVAIHVLMDLPTSYGTRLLSPFDWHWYAFDWMPIIDIYLLIALGAGLFFGRTSAAAARRNAWIAVALIGANYGLRAVAHHQALALAPRVFGPTLPSRCHDAPETSSLLDRWPRNVRLKADTTKEVVSGFSRTTSDAVPGSRRTNRCLVEVAAVPTFLSPLDWHLIAQTSNSYDVRDVNVADARVRSAASPEDVMWRQTVRYPNVWTPAAFEAAGAPLGRTFLGFSRFPAARSFTDGSGVTVVRFIDMRFAAGLVALEQPIRRPQPFSATIRIGPDGAVVGESLGR
jgi:hypothetical protein